LNVTEVAEELGLDPAAILRMCRDRGIRASWEESELSDESVDQLRQAMAPVPDEPVGGGAAVATGGPPSTPSVPTSSSPGAVAPLPPGLHPIGTASAPLAAASPSSQPAFGSIDPRMASLVSEPDAEPAGSLRAMRPPRTPEVASAFASVVVAVIAIGAWAACHALPHWDRGRWWLAGAALALVTVVAALRSLVVGVAGLMRASRFANARRGRPESAAIIAVAAIVLVAGVLLGAYDYKAVDVPAAYRRLTTTITREKNKTQNQLDNIHGTVPGDGIAPEGNSLAGLAVGDCLSFTIAGDLNSGRVDCTAAHRFEVVGLITLPSMAYPGAEVLAQEAKSACKGPFTAYIGIAPADSRYGLISTYPSKPQWEFGARGSACIASSAQNEDSSAHGSNR